MKLCELEAGEAFKIYAIQSGRDCPVEDFLTDAMHTMPEEAEKLAALLERTANQGIPKNKTKVNTLGDGLFEFKTNGGIRIPFFYDVGKLILCTHGFIKKRQTTPQKEIKRARDFMKAYKQAKKAGKISHD